MMTNYQVIARQQPQKLHTARDFVTSVYEQESGSNCAMLISAYREEATWWTHHEQMHTYAILSPSM